jgi:hypothetical protein
MRIKASSANRKVFFRAADLLNCTAPRNFAGKWRIGAAPHTNRKQLCRAIGLCYQLGDSAKGFSLPRRIKCRRDHMYTGARPPIKNFRRILEKLRLVYTNYTNTLGLNIPENLGLDDRDLRVFIAAMGDDTATTREVIVTSVLCILYDDATFPRVMISLNCSTHR